MFILVADYAGELALVARAEATDALQRAACSAAAAKAAFDSGVAATARARSQREAKAVSEQCGLATRAHWDAVEGEKSEAAAAKGRATRQSQVRHN